MTSEPRPEFWELYHRLPDEAKASARKTYMLFMQNPGHPSRHFKPLEGLLDAFESVQYAFFQRTNVSKMICTSSQMDQFSM